MDTEHDKVRLFEYLDGALSEENRKEFEGHLAECPSCRALIEEYRRLGALISGLPPIEPSARFYEEFRKKIGALRRAEKPLWSRLASGPRRRIGVAAVATAVAVVALVVFFTREVPVDKELIENMETIQQMDLLQNYDVLLELENLEELQEKEIDNIEAWV